MKITTESYFCDLCGCPIEHPKAELKFKAKKKILETWTKVDICIYCIDKIVEARKKEEKE